MVGQVCTAVDAAVATVTGVQIGLESFGLGLLHHVFEEHRQTKTMSDHICKDKKKKSCCTFSSESDHENAAKQL